ncbi:hypothetical protein LJR234_006641 [Mesorhizobium amorphae]|uniref:hypothetical protein n=1 Tax=Mesorhizobium amorphae TaxID=71433 RepID=UPI003ED030C2
MIETQRRLWWIYQANDLCHIAFETLLKFTLDNLGDHSAGISLARLLPLCVGTILAAMETEPANRAGFLDSLNPAANAFANHPTAEWSMVTAIMKGAGRSDQSVCSPETAWTRSGSSARYTGGCALTGTRSPRCLEGSRLIFALCSPRSRFWTRMRQ